MENILTILCGISALFLCVVGAYGFRKGYEKEGFGSFILALMLAIIAIII